MAAPREHSDKKTKIFENLSAPMAALLIWLDVVRLEELPEREREAVLALLRKSLRACKKKIRAPRRTPMVERAL